MNLNAQSVALALVVDERRRQERLRDTGKFLWCCDTTNDVVTDADKHVILSEEVGEVARAIQERNLPKLLEELIQVSAVALATAEALISQGIVLPK